MTRLLRRTAHRWPAGAAALGLASLALTAAAGPAAATAEPVGACTSTSGVILAVDFSPWGGPLLRACGSTPTTGYQLLNQGGWHSQGDNHNGPAFVCRISYSGYHGGAAYPTASQDPCIVTPPASAYWSYWHADPGQDTWSYSQLGAMSYHPEPGSVDLWVFGGTNIAGTTGSAVPSFSPDALRALNTFPVTNPTLGGKPQASHSQSPVPWPPASEIGPTSTSEPGTPTGAAAASASADSAAAAGGGTSTARPPSAPPIENVGPGATAAPIGGHGSALPALLTLGAVLLLGAAGAAIALRRPRSDD